MNRREWAWRSLAVLFGVVLGWLANDMLSDRYVFHIGGTGIARMNPRTGEVWVRSDDEWKPLR